ncbi:RNA-dependent RNA polymerase [Botrytis cinerea ourmia-like virus 5]|uniref:RNA-dependent RNA polymerase n=1 Tax=Botrytis cinerea ourmia-like virus 5 TaxID=2735955 RepID=A0ABX6NZ70_9VIRU|nr:RNA-dependent RNA polymerase [Botrytis cinerea ourmia-like virus 5]QJT73671.1 RNA-dependent RNA polymerase [Botrytis cinerea ourmia-like virus 5]
MNLGRLRGQETTVVELPNSFTGETVEGCKSQTFCRLRQVRQIRALRRILASLQSSCNPGRGQIMSLGKDLPTYPSSSQDSLGSGWPFWQSIKDWSKKISNLTILEIKKKKLIKKSVNTDALHSLSFSLSLIGKSLHAPCDCFSAVASGASHHQNQSGRIDNVTPEYLGFVGDMTKKIFTKGWDVAYKSTCLSSVLSANACYEGGRKKFGPLGSKNYLDHYDYMEKILGNQDFDFQSLCRFAEVNSAGKVRPLVVTHSSFEILRPLHKTIYNYISRFPWLLRGPPSSKSFEGIINDTGSFVSVDFENATDNLSVLAAERILGVALNRATSIPSSVRDAALRSLRPTIVYDQLGYDFEKMFEFMGVGVDSSRTSTELSMGQMMGSLLSFPILCLQTFFFYLYASGQTNLTGKELRGFNRCLVNGDDLVFRTDDEKAFFLAASETCSVINKKKTQVSSVFFNINSTLFKLRRDGRAHSVPFLRPKQLDIDSCLDVGSKVRETTRWLAPGSKLQKNTFDTMMKRAVRVTKAQGWSFFKSGFSGEKQMAWLRSHGLLRHEALIYGFQPNEPPVPRDESPLQEDCVIVDKGKYSVVAPLLEDLGKLYFSWSRFERTLPLEKKKWDEHKEMSKSRFDWRSAESERIKRKKKFERMGLKFPEHGSKFPLPLNDKIFLSEKKLQNFVKERLIKKKDKEIIVSQRMLDILSGACDRVIGPRTIRVHPYLIETAQKKIFKYFKHKKICS